MLRAVDTGNAFGAWLRADDSGIHIVVLRQKFYMNIAAANLADLNAIIGLLRNADLPVADITPAHLASFLVARNGDGIVGVIGLEVHAQDGLLRSLVVAPSHRGQRLGETLVTAIETTARQHGIDSLTLLTTTAAPFFTRLGYRTIERNAAPTSLHATAEFARLCPASAICLTKTV
jgi:amino-acid N-acetyltransferase